MTRGRFAAACAAGSALVAALVFASGCVIYGVPTRDPAMFGERLFDGATLTGWTAVAGDGRDASGTWSVHDGVLVCTGSPTGYIKTTRWFENFSLMVEWRFDPAKGAGNSGVLLRMELPDHVWPKSIEAQLHSENAGDIWNIGEFPMVPDAARTEGRRTIKMHPSNEKPLGEWNRYYISLVGDRLEVRVNGLIQNVATGCGGGVGPIGLQAEGAYIEFRNIIVWPEP